MAIRQQRTSYGRGVIAQSSPNLKPDISWLITNQTGNDIEFTLDGSVEGLVIKGVSPFEVVGTGLLPISMVWVPPVLTVTFDGAPGGGQTVQIRQGTPEFRNRFGGSLAPGTQEIPIPPSVPADSTVNLASFNATTLFLGLASGPAGFGATGVPLVQNVTTAEFALNVRCTPGSIELDFPISGLTAGDQVDMTLLSPLLFNEDGGRVEAFSFGL